MKLLKILVFWRLTYDNAGRIIEVVNNKFNKYGFPEMDICRNIIPTDNTTLFVCSGMQELKNRFQTPDNSTYSSLQSCIRTNDLDAIGDGTHLSSFEMIGNFSFSAIEYKKSCEMWLEIVDVLGVMPDYVTFHPECEEHQKIWESLGQTTVESEECVWSDGDIGGYCTEMFKSDIEIGNLVNTAGTMTDVGFGAERLAMFMENKDRADMTSLFPQVDNPVLRDHLRTIDLLHENNVFPGNKRRNYISRLLIRRCLAQSDLDFFRNYEFFQWFADEHQRKEKAILSAKSSIRRHRNKDYQFWFATFGVLPEEIDRLKLEFL